MTAEEMDRQNHGKIAEIIRRICGNHLSDAETELSNRKESLYRQMYRPYLRLIAGLEAFLDNARQLQIPMAIATSAGQHNLDFTVDGLELRPYFDAFVGGDDVTQGKPHPETFLLAAQRLNVAPAQCIRRHPSRTKCQNESDRNYNNTTRTKLDRFSQCAANYSRLHVN